MKILIIEDNVPIVRGLESGLKSFYAIDVAYTGNDALLLIDTMKYDTILLDLNLPDITGEEICQKLRSTGIDTPIIVLSGRGEIEDKINLLNMGADDYITKPFNVLELRARIQVAMRHTSNNGPDGKLVISDLVLDPAKRTVTRAGDRIILRRKEFDLLEYLLRNKGQVLTRVMILEHIWDMNENLWANVIDVHIKHLRDKIDRPYGVKLIHTVHGLGYRLEAIQP